MLSSRPASPVSSSQPSLTLESPFDSLPFTLKWLTDQSLSPLLREQPLHTWNPFRIVFHSKKQVLHTICIQAALNTTGGRNQWCTHAWMHLHTLFTRKKKKGANRNLECNDTNQKWQRSTRVDVEAGLMTGKDNVIWGSIYLSEIIIEQ